jgi:2-furoyl-CoA dehydrogenase large subunit
VRPCCRRSSPTGSGSIPPTSRSGWRWDTAKDFWSLAAGTYSCPPGTAVAAHVAATRIRDKLAAIAAKQLNVLPDDVQFAGGKIRSRANPDNALPFGRVAGTAHWSPAMLPDVMAPGLAEVDIWSPGELEPPASDDRINTSLTYGSCSTCAASRSILRPSRCGSTAT